MCIVQLSVRCGNCQHNSSEAEPVKFYHHARPTQSAGDVYLGVARASEGVSLPPCAQVSLLVVLVSPNLEHVGVNEWSM